MQLTLKWLCSQLIKHCDKQSDFNSHIELWGSDYYMLMEFFVFLSEKINYSVMFREMDMSDQKAERKSQNMKHQLNVDLVTRESENLFVPDKIIKFWSLGTDKNNC